MTNEQEELDLPLAVQHAERAAEAVRALNHATLNVGQVQWPSDVDMVVAYLEMTARRMPQALRQLSHWLRVKQAAGLIGHDHGNDRAAEAVAAALEEIAEAVRDADELRISLGNARSFTNHLTGKSPGEDPPQDPPSP